MKERGFSLVEMMVVVLVFSIATVALSRSLLSRSKRSADTNAVKNMITLAARRSVVEAKHFGVHFDSTQHTASLFVDRDNDDIYNGTDTVSSLARLNPLGKLKLSNSGGAASGDICFKKNGAISSGNSYQIVFSGAAGDSSKLQVIAASGRVLGP